MQRSLALTMCLVGSAAAGSNKTLALNATRTFDGICAVVGYDLPSECQCQEGQNNQFQISCQIDFLDVDEIQLFATFAPCNQPAQAAFEVREADAGIDYTKQYSGGEAMEFPVPGLTAGIPVIGSAQVSFFPQCVQV